MSYKTTLPPYKINDPKSKNNDVLRTPAKQVTFPLDDQIREILYFLEKKFDQEENCAGLAAPQIGYGHAIIILALETNENLKKFRSDLTDTLPKSIWINPTCTPLSSSTTTDWEACFSVPDCVGRVPRFTQISYKAWTSEGKTIEGRAQGFLARIIQHEIDHLHGKLFIDYLPKEELLTLEQFNTLRESEQAKNS